MKKVLLTAAAVFVTLSIYAQGRVNFQNSVALSAVRNGEKGGVLASQADGIRVALYWAPLSDPQNFVQLGNAANVGGPPPVPGQFVGGARTTGTATAPGAEALFIVKAWEAAYGTTYEAAKAAAPMNGRATQFAESPVFRITTPGSDLLPAAPLEGTSMNPGFTGFTVNVPEPSVIALGLIGAGSLLLFRRRK